MSLSFQSNLPSFGFENVQSAIAWINYLNFIHKLRSKNIIGGGELFSNSYKDSITEIYFSVINI